LEVTALSEAEVQSRSRSRHFNFNLNSDGRRHPVINASAAYALVAGVVSMVLGLLTLAHVVGSVLGITAFLVGLGAQMVSATRDQRMVIVCGIVAAFVGMGLGIAHGGFA
jgi:hypothetical protein